MKQLLMNTMTNYDVGIIRVKTSPFRKIKIPKADPPEKKGS